MKKLLLLLSAVWVGSTFAAQQSSVSQYGITWTFDQAYETGQFANGDWWVLGPVVITAITPDASGGLNGWEVNPSFGAEQGYDNRVGGYNAGRMPSLPYPAAAGQSIIKTVSLAACDRTCLKSAAVLTVLGELPPDNGAAVFRPPYAGTDKTLYPTSRINTAFLRSLAPVPGPPTLAQVKQNFDKVHLDHKEGWSGRSLHPEDNMPDYGADLSITASEAVLRLMLNDPVADKMGALVAYLQYGLDTYRLVELGGVWNADGGIGWGRKLPVAFAGLILDDPEIKNVVMTADAGTFAPDHAVFYSDNTNAPGGMIYGDAVCSEQSYWDAVITHNGCKHCRDPYGYIDGGIEPGGSYQDCCSSQPMKQIALAVRLVPGLKECWGDTGVLAYADRWVDFGAWAQPDPCAPATASMDDYGVAFGPDGQGGCIRDNHPADGIGRFPGLHGTNTDGGGRASTFANAMWQYYRDSTATTGVGGYPSLPCPVNDLRLTIGDLRFMNIAGKVMAAGEVRNTGIYLLYDKEKNKLHKTVIVRSRP